MAMDKVREVNIGVESRMGVSICTPGQEVGYSLAARRTLQDL